MTTEENKAIVGRFIEGVANEGNLALIDELIDAQFVNHNPPPGVTSAGPEGMKQAIGLLRRAFSGMHLTIDDLVAEGDKVVWRWTTHATHQGEFLGIAPTGKHVTWSGITVFRLQGGKIVERWGKADDLGLLQQLRAVAARA